jgi:hypothetical protein
MPVRLKLIMINTAFAEAVLFYVFPNHATNLIHLMSFWVEKRVNLYLHYPIPLYVLHRNNFTITIIFNV